MNKDSKRYYKDIKSVFPSRGQQEKRLIRDCKMRIIELGKLKPDITYDELQQHLGIPTDIVIQYYEGADIEYIMQNIHTARMIRFCIYCILIFILTGFSISAGINIRLYQEIHQGVITHEKTIIK